MLLTPTPASEINGTRTEVDVGTYGSLARNFREDALHGTMFTEGSRSCQMLKATIDNESSASDSAPSRGFSMCVNTSFDLLALNGFSGWVPAGNMRAVHPLSG